MLFLPHKTAYIMEGPYSSLFHLGGRIDHAHHDNNAYRALNDTVAMSDAVKKAVGMTSDQDTLILVTADHSHVFTMAGYPYLDDNILGTWSSHYY